MRRGLINYRPTDSVCSIPIDAPTQIVPEYFLTGCGTRFSTNSHFQALQYKKI